jgi:hypothetical protein
MMGRTGEVERAAAIRRAGLLDCERGWAGQGGFWPKGEKEERFSFLNFKTHSNK